MHYLLWFRRGIQEGLSRKAAVMLAYKGCARAMYQSWGVIGIGLSAFALSPFGPTQRFGMMMLAMLTVALLSNLLFMPTLLAGPLGAIFERGIKRKMQRAHVKAKPAEIAGAPKRKFHEAEVPVVPSPKTNTVPVAPAPQLPVGTNVAVSAAPKAITPQPAATKPPAPHVGAAKPAPKKPNAA
jgi:hypothetical protein